MVEEVLAASPHARRDFGEPYRGLDCFDLAEEGPNATEAMVPPVLEQPGRLWRHLPLAGVRQIAPAVNLLTNPVDDDRQVVLLAGVFELSRRLVEHQRGLLGGCFLALLRLRNRRDKLGCPAAFDDLLGRLPGLV